MKDIVWRLLRRNISKSQLAGYAIANFAGLLIILCALQFYSDITATSDDEPLSTEDYLIISKKVEGFGSILTREASTEFSPAEIAELKSQPWVNAVGEFTNADFSVYAGVDFGGKSMGTALFLESVPDEYFDIMPRNWGFNPTTDTTVPVIISKDYLTLYNFGFAPSRGMPQVSEAMVGMVPLNLSISGNGKYRNLKGKIVGFSSRINTVAVPEQFMDWANGEFAQSGHSAPSRLIIRSTATGDPAVTKYLESHGYETAGDKSELSRTLYVMRLITAGVIVIGAIISALSLVILFLSIALLLQKNSEKISTLLLLGYSPEKVASYYVKTVICINAAVTVAVIASMEILRSQWIPSVKALGNHESQSFMPVAIILLVAAIITIINIIYLHSGIRKLYRR